MAKRQSSDQQKRIATTLRKMQRLDPATELSLFKTVEKHFTDIETMRAHGHKWSTIAGGLRAIGTDISDTTLRLYMSRIKTARLNKGAARMSQPTVNFPKTTFKVRDADAPAKKPVETSATNPRWLTSEPNEDDL